MHIDDWRRVETIFHDRKTLLRKIEVAARGNMGVTLEGSYQNDEIVDTARYAVVWVLERMLECLDDELRGFGIEVPPNIPAAVSVTHARPETFETLYRR